MKPSSVLFNVNVNLKMTLLQVYATLQESHDLHSCLTSSNSSLANTSHSVMGVNQPIPSRSFSFSHNLHSSCGSGTSVVTFPA